MQGSPAIGYHRAVPCRRPFLPLYNGSLLLAGYCLDSVPTMARLTHAPAHQQLGKLVWQAVRHCPRITVIARLEKDVKEVKHI